ncbi:hypothetical protein LTR67_000764 [Exophiala xenobiotica]
MSAHFESAQKGENNELVDFYSNFDKNSAGAPIPGVPKLDIKRMVDGGKRISFLKPTPPTSAGRQFEQRMKVIGVYDKGKAGTVVQTETDLVDVETNDVYTRVIGNNFYIGQGGWGGPKGPSAEIFTPPKRHPDLSYLLVTTQETALLYRLNGDTNPLHAIPEPGRQMGFKGAIIHGLWTYNATLYAVLNVAGDSQAANIKSFEAKFASPLYPGDKATVQVWRLGQFDSEGYEEIRFVVQHENGKEVLTNGRAFIKPVSWVHKL